MIKEMEEGNDQYSYCNKFITPNNNSIEFNFKPHYNFLGTYGDPRLLYVDKQGRPNATGMLGEQHYYYLPNNIIDKINNIFEEFHIPRELYNELIWAFLSMSFAYCRAKEIENLKQSRQRIKEEDYITYNLKNSISNASAVILEIEFKYSVTTEPNKREIKKHKITSPQTIIKINNIISQYQTNLDSEINEKDELSRKVEMFLNAAKRFNKETDINKKFGADIIGQMASAINSPEIIQAWLVHGKKRRTQPNKNHLKKYQAKYTNLIYKHLENSPCSKIISKNKMLLFICQLMKLSGLIPEEDIAEHIDSELIGYMRQKIRSEYKTKTKNG